RDARLARAHRQADARAERETGHPERKVRVALREDVERRERVLLLARAAVVSPRRGAHAAEVEAQHGDARLVEGLGGPVDDVVVHRAAAQRVRMANDRRRDGGLRLLEQALELTMSDRNGYASRR